MNDYKSSQFYKQVKANKPKPAIDSTGLMVIVCSVGIVALSIIAMTDPAFAAKVHYVWQSALAWGME